MRMHVLGCSHQKTPVAVRECLAFSADQARSALGQLRSEFPGTEAVLLSTCNRVELYTASEKPTLPNSRQLAHFVARFHGLESSLVLQQLSGREGPEAVRHLFEVTSSLDSMVLGEPQITSQVKEAYSLAQEQQATGPVTHAAFQAAFRTARRVATETGIHRHRVSIPSVAVADFARRVFERFDDKNVLLIGAGEMASDTMEYLQAEGARTVTVINRSPSRAVELAKRWNGQVRCWKELHEGIIWADLIVSTTSSAEPIISVGEFVILEKSRDKRPLFIVDLAVPRDFDPLIGERPSVYLYSVDDLQAACEANRRQRQRDLPRAQRIIESETGEFLSALNRRAIGPIVQQLRRNWEGVKELELQRLARRLPELDDRTRKQVADSLERLVNKLLHPPLESLRRESQQGIPERLLQSVSRLFKLEQ